jgi:hypothetical protein
MPALHESQRRVRDNAGRYTVLMCGRRWGKTRYGIDVVVREALEARPVAWFAPTYKFLAEVWHELAVLLRPVTAWSSSTERQIRLITGGIIDCWTLDTPDAGRGRRYAHVIIDEAGLVHDLATAWHAAIRPTLTDLRGRATFLGTPRGRREFYRLYRLGESGEPGWRSHRLPTAENPFIDRAEIEEARRMLPPEVFAQEYEAIPAENAGNPFGLAAIEACTGPMSDEPTWCYGIDVARAQDWLVCIGVDRQRRVTELHRWRDVPWSESIDRLASIIGDRRALMDSTGVGDAVLDALQRVRPRVEGYVFTQRSKQDLMERLAVAIQGGQVRFPPGPIADELRDCVYEYTRTGVRYAAPSGSHDDCVCALALALRHAESAVPAIYTPGATMSRGGPSPEGDGRGDSRARLLARWLADDGGD